MCKKGAFGSWKVVVVMLGLALSEVQAEEFFPIGAWFPVGGITRTLTQLNAIFDDVVAANFNVVHGPLIGDTEISNMRRGNPSAVQPVPRVQDFLNTAYAKGLKVQLYSWDLIPNLWDEENEMLSYPLDVLGGRFQHTGYEVDLAERAVVARAGMHSPGYMLTTNLSFFGINGGFDIHERYDYHLFRLSINDNRPGSAVVRLQILDTANTVLVQEEITPEMFDGPDTYQEFEVHHPITASQRLRYRVDYLGGRDVRIDKISPADQDARDLLRSETTQYAPHGAFNTFDDHLQKVLNDHAGFPALWRFAVSDEPSLSTLESTGYVENFFRTSPTNPQKAISAIGNHGCGNSRERCVHEFPRWANPDVMLIDGYPIGDSPQPYTPHTFNPMPGPGDSNYSTELQDRWDRHLLPILQSARDSTLTHDPPIPFWYIAQAHSWAPDLRDPTPEEIRAMVYLALTHGAKGIYYFMYSSHVDGDGVADIDGLVDGTYATTGNAKWTEVQVLNAMLEKLDDTLLELTSNAVFADDALADFVHGLSDPDPESSDTADYHLGTFTHTDGSHYLMVVNLRCQSSDNREVTVTLDASQLSGTEYVYRMTDVYSNERVTDSSSDDSSNPSFSISLEPGEGKLYRIEPMQWKVSFESDSYEALEGGDGVLITVELSPLLSQAVSIPVQVSADADTEAGDYTVPNLADGTVTLSFAAGVSSQSFTLTANEDDDSANGTVTLSFGTPLPSGITEGMPSEATVTLLDDAMPSFSPDSDSKTVVAGTSFPYTLPDAQGGNSPINYSYGGSLPAGLARSGTSISGTVQADQSGDFSVTRTATDADGDTATFTLDITVVADTEPVFSPSGGSEDAIVGIDFDFTLPSASGGNAPLSYSVSSSTCTDFTVIYSSVRGTPSSAGQCGISWAVTDTDGDTDTYALQISVYADTERQTAYRLHTSGTTAPSFSALSSGVPSGWSSSRQTPTSSNRYEWEISRTRPTGGSWSSWGSATVVSTYGQTSYRPGNYLQPLAFTASSSGLPTGWSLRRMPTWSNRYGWRISRTLPAGGS